MLAAFIEQDRCSCTKYIKMIGIFARHFQYNNWDNFLYRKYTKLEEVINMELEKLKKSTIIKLKKIKQEQNLSIKKIMDLLEDRGQFVSEGTLKKIFAEGSEEKSFRYQDTLAPLADVLLDIYGDQSEINDAGSLKQIIREKNKQIEFLMVKLEEQKDVYAERKAMYERRIEDLNAQLKRLDISVERKDKIIEQLMDKYLFNENTAKN